MKAKLGLAIGFNVAVACLLMQGCKAPGARGSANASDVRMVEESPAPAKAPSNDINVSQAPAPAVAAETAPAVVPETAPAPAPGPVVAETAPVAVPAPIDDNFTLYTVRPGDMLSKISRRFNVRQKAILDLNPGLMPNKLYVGKKIKLPGKVDVGAEPAPAAVPVASAASIKAPKAAKAAKYTGATKEYVVKSGDSLGKIAHIHGTNVRTIKELNGLKSDRLSIGKKLKVPATKAAAKTPAAKTSKKGPAKAAKKGPAKTTDDNPAKGPDVKEKENEDNTAVPEPNKDENKNPAVETPAAPVADPVVTPDAPATAPAPAPATAETAAAPASETAAAPVSESVAAPAAAPTVHTVKEGEDVVSIAISYGISPSALMDANDLKSSEVKPGDQLKIPVKNAQ